MLLLEAVVVPFGLDASMRWGAIGFGSDVCCVARRRCVAILGRVGEQAHLDHTHSAWSEKAVRDGLCIDPPCPGPCLYLWTCTRPYTYPDARSSNHLCHLSSTPVDPTHTSMPTTSSIPDLDCDVFCSSARRTMHRGRLCSRSYLHRRHKAAAEAVVIFVFRS